MTSVVNSAVAEAAAGEEPEDTLRPLDLVHLSKYTLGNRTLESELLGLFRTQTGLYIARLEAAESAKEWMEAAHSLKGSARGLGAWQLASLAEEAEGLAHDAVRHPAILERIRAAIGTVNLFIDEIMAA